MKHIRWNFWRKQLTPEPLTILTVNSVIDIWLGVEHTSVELIFIDFFYWFFTLYLLPSPWFNLCEVLCGGIIRKASDMFDHLLFLSYFLTLCSISIPHENVRKSLVLLKFHGGTEMEHWAEIGYVTISLI